jgi:hypothetical protein
MNASDSGPSIAAWFVNSLLRARVCHALFLLAAFSTTALYFPGLKGSYFFDDYPNIVENTRLHVDSLDWRQWQEAIWSSNSSLLRRPLASFTFALNYYFDGLNPWPMKSVNLAIHLLNGWLLYLLLIRTAALLQQPAEAKSRFRLLALLTSAAWLVHPINLTTVLYVVQRMEGLAQLFILAGLLLFVDARSRQQENRDGAAWRLWVGVPFLMVIGALAKESAVLLPLFALSIEAVVPRSDSSRRNVSRVASFFLVFLIIPFVIGLIWTLERVSTADAFSLRPFTLGQRLLTEPRIVLDYVYWILVPLPRSFGFYHDAIPLSTSMTQPWTTGFAMLSLLAMMVGGFLLRRRRPMAALGIFWFLGAHTLTATILPLELAFEHRNYFASAGLILTAFDLILPDRDHSRFSTIGKACIGAFLALCCFATWLRSEEWSNPIALALAEVTRNPDSPRATYEYGRTLAVRSDYKTDSPLVPEAFEALSKASKVPDSGILPEVALIMLASRTGRPMEGTWWQRIVDKLSRGRAQPGDEAALKSLTLCQRKGLCVVDDERMLQVYLAAVGSGGGTPSNLYSYAIFAYGRLHDSDLALRLVYEASEKSANDPQYRLNLVDFLIALGRKDEARAQLAILKREDHFGALTLEISKRESTLRED